MNKILRSVLCVLSTQAIAAFAADYDLRRGDAVTIQAGVSAELACEGNRGGGGGSSPAPGARDPYILEWCTDLSNIRHEVDCAKLVVSNFKLTPAVLALCKEASHYDHERMACAEAHKGKAYTPAEIENCGKKMRERSSVYWGQDLTACLRTSGRI